MNRGLAFEPPAAWEKCVYVGWEGCVGSGRAELAGWVWSPTEESEAWGEVCGSGQPEAQALGTELDADADATVYKLPRV